MKDFHIGRFWFLKTAHGYNNFSIGDPIRLAWHVGVVIFHIGDWVVWWKTN